MPDTGASQPIVSTDVSRDARLLIRPTQTELRNTSGTVMKLLGEADAILCNDKHSVMSTVLVASHINHSALVSLENLPAGFFLSLLTNPSYLVRLFIDSNCLSATGRDGF